MIHEFIKQHIILADGAMGTYFSETTDQAVNRVELANIDNPEIIKSIHKEYINSGSKLIRTNTFSANSYALEIERTQLKDILVASINNAKNAIDGKQVFIAGNIGPIPEMSNDGNPISTDAVIDEYFFIIDQFIANGIHIFNFETFYNDKYLERVVSYIRSRVDNSFIMVNFSVDKFGTTRSGNNIKELIDRVDYVDSLGLNCGSGPAHVLHNLNNNNFKLPIAVYPNAGYPEIENNRTVFKSDPIYFAETVFKTLDSGTRIIGGCCGTTPNTIKYISQLLNGEAITLKTENIIHIDSEVSKSNGKISKNLIVAVELDPPSKPNLEKIISNAADLKDAGVDLITVADSPSGRMRLNSIIVASRISRECNIEVMPHISCRDRNLIGLKSDILAAYTEGIRKILFVTGDPVPEEERNIVKKVFNCNSISLMEQVKKFNVDLLPEGDQLTIGGALNLNSRNVDLQKKRLYQKVDAGASLFLTQPIYSDKPVEFLKTYEKRGNEKILAGIMPIVTYNNAQFLNNEFPGITIPEEIISRFSPDMDRKEAEDVGIGIAIECVEKLKGFVDGFYFITPFSRTHMIKEIINRTLKED